MSWPVSFDDLFTAPTVSTSIAQLTPTETDVVLAPEELEEKILSMGQRIEQLTKDLQDDIIKTKVFFLKYDKLKRENDELHTENSKLRDEITKLEVARLWH